jgi:2-methylcitrate dehydratase PrpD
MARSNELQLAAFVRALQREQIPDAAVRLVKLILLAVCGTAVAGAGEEGCDRILAMLRHQGGTAEATVLVHGHKLPVASAALANGVMARALDFCDAMVPGLHIGSSLVPAAFAAAELAGGCSGKDFLTALAAGAEASSRLNLTEDTYDGFDPTGVAGVFGATAAAARLLSLDEDQTLNALALAFNRCGGSFQSNVDGSLAVRLIQGWVAETGVNCALLAKNGITGPANFLDGIYGYGHLFGRDRVKPGDLLQDLGNRFVLTNTVFKRYPSCGCTQGVTELALGIVRETHVSADEIEAIEVRVPPYAYKLVGGDFAIGDNPRVNAQFSLQYCVANALVRKGSALSHFRPADVQAPEVLALIDRVKVVSDPSMDERGHTAVDLTIRTRHPKTFAKSLDVAPGFPGNPLTDDEHRLRFEDCMKYARKPLPPHQATQLRDAIFALDEVKDVRALIQLLVIG